MKTVIRQASIDDKMAIWDFIKVAYGDHAKEKIPDRWNWQFIENVLVNRSGKELPIFIAIKDDHIVGQVGAVLSQIKIVEEVQLIAAGVDLIVLPNCRGEGIAQRLLQALCENYKLYYSIACAGATRRIFDRIEHLGYRKFEPIPTYLRFVKLEKETVFNFLMEKTINHFWVQNIAKFGCRFWLDKIISVVVNSLIEIRDLLERQTKREFRSEIKEVKRFGDEIDQLWNKINNEFKVIVKRDKQFLNWRFTECPQLDYRKFISRRAGEANGYLVVRKPEPTELNVGIIVDLFASPEDNETIENLISHAIEFFGKDVLAIECPTSLKQCQRVLLRSGFLKIKKTQPIFFCVDSRIRSKLEKWENSWCITKAEQDWDQFRPI